MTCLLWQIGAVFWIISGNSYVGEMYFAVGVMYVNSEKNQKLKTASVVAAAIAQILAFLNLAFGISYTNLLIAF